MQRDKAYLLDILEAARLARQYVQDKSYGDFFGDLQCQDAVVRRLEVIGEAARRVSETTRNELPELPWKDIIAMRNFLIHDYDDIDMSIVWETVHEHLPGLISALEKVIEP
jgi:uncharacterized protein with HEPN domain